MNGSRGDQKVTQAADQATARQALEEELAALARARDGGAQDRGTVMLDQQSVGRLSRMDALQRQAMAAAQAGQIARREARIRAALARMDEGEWGYCTDCGEEIGAKRLQADPSVPLCLSCAKG